MDPRHHVRRRRLCCTLTRVCLFVLIATNVATADPLLPPAAPLHRFVFGQLLLLQSANGLNFDDFGQHTLEESYPPSGKIRVSFSTFGEPVPYVFAEGGAAAPFKSGRTLGTLIYEFEVVGPEAAVDPVQVRVDAFGHVFATASEEGVAVVRASWSLTDATLGFAPVFEEGLQATQESIEDEFDHQVNLSMAVNHVFRVTLFADVFFNSGKFGAHGLAFMDPVFSFAPGVGPEYSFRFADGIGNGTVAAVPEPASALLLCVGVTAIGLVGRRARR
jgi:hypothetical protein